VASEKHLSEKSPVHNCHVFLLGMPDAYRFNNMRQSCLLACLFTFIPYSCAQEKSLYFLHSSTGPEPSVGDASDTGGQK